jgi:hypothetical protein
LWRRGPHVQLLLLLPLILFPLLPIHVIFSLLLLLEILQSLLWQKNSSITISPTTTPSPQTTTKTTTPQISNPGGRARTWKSNPANDHTARTAPQRQRKAALPSRGERRCPRADQVGTEQANVVSGGGQQQAHEQTVPTYLPTLL